MDPNKIILRLLDSPLHVMLSGSIMRLTFTGRKSGTQYTTPVNYVYEKGADGVAHYWTLSDRDRTWWRNLRGGAPVTLVVKRVQIAAEGCVIEAPAAVAEALTHFLTLAPGAARMLQAPSTQGVLDADALQQAAQKRVIVRFTPQARNSAHEIAYCAQTVVQDMQTRDDSEQTKGEEP